MLFFGKENGRRKFSFIVLFSEEKEQKKLCVSRTFV